MPLRQIVLDTETTGLRTEDGHRIIEIGCLEMIDRKLTGQHFHQYINPERDVEAGALAVHGITNEFLRDKPIFQAIANDFMAFIQGAELIIHNAPFDLGFLNYELNLARQGWKLLTNYCHIIDTLQIARQLHVGQRNSLDALCKRYGVDNSKREWHGALLDAHLLTQVYLAMTGGQGSFFDELRPAQSAARKNEESIEYMAINKTTTTVLQASPEELTEHEKYLQQMRKRGKCLWLEN